MEFIHPFLYPLLRGRFVLPLLVDGVEDGQQKGTAKDVDKDATLLFALVVHDVYYGDENVISI